MNRLRWLGRSALAVFCFLALGLLFAWQQPKFLAVPLPPIPRESSKKPAAELPQVACIGPRGIRLDHKYSYDLPRRSHSFPNVSFPEPTTGSYEALGLEKTWMSFDQRYGPYGYGEDAEAYRFPRVDWNLIDWGQLQAACLQDNQHIFAGINGSVNVNAHAENRLRFRGTGFEPVTPTSKTGRQAIVMRTWSTYEYKDEDLWNLRSIITEASLATGGKYTVILLVDVKCKGCEVIHTDENEYRRVLEASVPKEFQNIAVLFHVSLQKSHYKKVKEHKPFWQIMQPLQLLAHFYNDFDHFWQFEMDSRFTGRLDLMLNAWDDFGKAEPYKQAVERATWQYIPEIFGTYQKFSDGLNKAMHGSATVWGAIKTKNVKPIGPQPPYEDPRNETFEWLVGHEADLLLLAQINDVRKNQERDDWVFADWHRGNFGNFKKIARYMSVPAQGRASWELLEGIHRAQQDYGLAVAGEATLPSFAVWLGLKVVALPVPKYQFPERDKSELSHVVNGDGFEKDGIANGPGWSRANSLADLVTRPMTWDWTSSLCDLVFNRWMEQSEHHKGNGGEPKRLPTFMAEVEGTVYMPPVSKSYPNLGPN